MKKIAILGSTGSIGVNALDVIKKLGPEYKVIALSADSNINLLAKQSNRFNPKIISIGTEERAASVRSMVGRSVRVVSGSDGLREIVSRNDVDLVLFAISGTACIMPLLDAIERKKEIAMANKEALVSAGPIIIAAAKAMGVNILPIDSEHSAIFQCMCGSPGEIAKIYLTGSGGPLLNIDKKKFNKLPPEFILKHPKWNMGKKITIDSATMMNKGLEIIEAKYLFGIDEKLIEVLVHPEAIVHSMVEFTDGAVIAQLAVPDMRLPIEYALTYPARSKAVIERLDFAKVANLSFRRPDLKKFPCLGLARAALVSGGSAPAVLCAADEAVVALYLEGKISFTDIPKFIEKVLGRHKNTGRGAVIADILDADSWAREEIKRLCYH